MGTEKALQTGSHAGHIHSRDETLFGHDGPKQWGRHLLSTKLPLCLPAWLSLPDEGESEGEQHEVRQFRQTSGFRAI